MERPRVKYLVNVKDFSYYDVDEINAYLAWLEQENKRLKELVDHWKLNALGPR